MHKFQSHIYVHKLYTFLRLSCIFTATGAKAAVQFTVLCDFHNHFFYDIIYESIPPSPGKPPGM